MCQTVNRAWKCVRFRQREDTLDVKAEIFSFWGKSTCEIVFCEAEEDASSEHYSSGVRT